MIYNENGEIVLSESLFKSALKDDFEKKPERQLSEFDRVSIFDYVKKEYGTFKKFINGITLGISIFCTPRIKNYAAGVEAVIDEMGSDKVDGCAFYDGKNLVAVIFIIKNKTANSLDYIEISKKYRGMGLSKQLLDMAVNEFKASIICVNNDNDVAKRIYLNYGFTPFMKWNNCTSMRLSKIIQKKKHFCVQKMSNYRGRRLGTIR